MDLRLIVIAIGASAGGNRGGNPRAELTAMPWLHGLADARITDEPRAAIADRFPSPAEDAECDTGATHGLELVVDVAPMVGEETVLATFAQGIVVLDREEQVIGSAPGHECQGSADEITALAAGKASGASTIALAITRGGHTERRTELSLFRITAPGRLDAVFTAEVEQARGDVVERGAIWLIPGGLIYHRPGGGRSLWTFDPVGGAYLFRGSFDASDLPLHAEPAPMTWRPARRSRSTDTSIVGRLRTFERS